MAVLVLAGPPAVGHNTIAELVCSLLDRAALIDLDEVREMIRAPQGLPGDGGDGDDLYRLSIAAGCSMACEMDRAGFNVLLVDVVPPETLDDYRRRLSETSGYAIVLLLTGVEELIRRDIERDPDPNPDEESLARWHERIRYLHEQLANSADAYDVVIDTTEAPETVARQLIGRLSSMANA